MLNSKVISKAELYLVLTFNFQYLNYSLGQQVKWFLFIAPDFPSIAPVLALKEEEPMWTGEDE